MTYLLKTSGLALLICSVTGCATERYISPTISGQPRAHIQLELPIIGAVLDGRAVKKPEDAASVLQRDLSGIYGGAITWQDYFSKIPEGRIGVRIRLVTLCSRFGSRLISTAAFSDSMANAQSHADAPWGSVVASASASQTTYAGSFSGEGWWNGAAWIDVEVVDRRFEKTVVFTVPIVAEDRETNMWGYASGNKAARVAWEKASERFTRTLDEIITTATDAQ